MTYESFAVVVLTAWLASGVVLGVVMRRHGYSGFGWGMLGALFGPVAVIGALLLREKSRGDVRERVGVSGDGRVDVLVGIDGSPEAVGAALAAVEVLGIGIGRFTLAAVAPYDATDEEEEAKSSALHDATPVVGGRLATLGIEPAAVLLHGPPAETLRIHATAEAYNLLVVGSHGRGLSKAVLGSVAASLVEASPVPLIISGRGLAAATERSQVRPATTQLRPRNRPSPR